MKAFLFFIILCLFISLNCKTSTEIMKCFLNKLSDAQCSKIVQGVNDLSIISYVNDNKATLVNYIKKCL